MVVVRSEGGRVEVDNGNVAMTKSLRKRTVEACSKVGVEATVCSGAGIQDGRWRWQRNSF
jgi:hypothetical protein